MSTLPDVAPMRSRSSWHSHGSSCVGVRVGVSVVFTVTFRFHRRGRYHCPSPLAVAHPQVPSCWSTAETACYQSSSTGCSQSDSTHSKPLFVFRSACSALRFSTMIQSSRVPEPTIPGSTGCSLFGGSSEMLFMGGRCRRRRRPYSPCSRSGTGLSMAIRLSSSEYSSQCRRWKEKKKTGKSR